MIEEKIEGYAFLILAVQLAFVLIGLVGIYPENTTFGGLNAYADIQNSLNSIQTMYEDISGNGLITATVIGAMMLGTGIKILFEFIIMVIVGTYPMMVSCGLPAAFALPISGIIGAVMLYGLSVKFLGR